MAERSDIQLILGNSNKRFSGVTSTMIQVLPHQQKELNVAVLGNHHLPEGSVSISYIEFLKLCRKKTSAGKYRVFHARRNDEMIQALIAKYLFGAKIKIVFTSTAQRHHSKFTQLLMSRMDSIITTCKAAGSYLIKPADITIPHGIDTHRYSPCEDRDSSWASLGYGGQRGVGIFGRIRPSKGTAVFIDAMIPLLKKDKELHAVICGETLPKFQQYEDSIQDKVREHQLENQVHFIGKQAFSKLPSIFQSLSCVVAASENEGFGLTVLESMASGTPVVATKAGAWEEVILNGDTGFCVEINNSSAMSEALAKVLSSDIETLGKNSREHILTNYSVEREATTLINHLMSLA